MEKKYKVYGYIKVPVCQTIKFETDDFDNEYSDDDIVEVAEEFIKHRTHNGKYQLDSSYNVIRKYELFELENDIAMYIDLKLPLHFWHKKYCEKHPPY